MSKVTSRKTAVILLIATVLLGFAGYVISHPQMFGLGDVLCNWYQFGEYMKCGVEYNFSIGIPLFYGMRYIAIPFLLLLFIPQTYDSWKKFGYWALPLIFILTVMMPPTQGGFIHYLPNRSGMAAFLSKWYMIISVAIIVYSWWRQSSGTHESNN